jgi:hypothetical protein
MVSAATGRTWLVWVVFFFAWGFVMHGVGLVLHEVGGHGLAATIVGCGFDGVDLTYFGHGFVRLSPCMHWTWSGRVLLDWAGLAVTISAGAVAMAFQRRAGLTPLGRLLLALVAAGFLLGQLSYATAGGFYEVYDPALTAEILESHGLHVLAWLPPLVLYAAAALYGARAIVDAFREHFGSRSRLHTLKQSTATLGAAGLLYFVALRIEAAIRTDMIPSIAVAAEQRAIVMKNVPRFPIEYVLYAIAVAAFVLALARPVRHREGAEGAALGGIPRRYAVGVAGAALVCAATIALLVRVHN